MIFIIVITGFIFSVKKAYGDVNKMSFTNKDNIMSLTCMPALFLRAWRPDERAGRWHDYTRAAAIGEALPRPRGDEWWCRRTGIPAGLASQRWKAANSP